MFTNFTFVFLFSVMCIYIKHKIILVVENNVNDHRNICFKICLRAVFFYILTNNVDVIYVDAFNEFHQFHVQYFESNKKLNMHRTGSCFDYQLNDGQQYS